jgi:hypothetical protein
MRVQDARSGFHGTKKISPHWCALTITPRENKMKKLVAIAMLVAFVSPALAADEFYVVQDVKTKKCTIVDKKPTVTTMTVVSPGGTVYKSRTEAETGMKTIKVCTSN